MHFISSARLFSCTTSLAQTHTKSSFIAHILDPMSRKSTLLRPISSPSSFSNMANLPQTLLFSPTLADTICSASYLLLPHIHTTSSRTEIESRTTNRKQAVKKSAQNHPPHVVKQMQLTKSSLPLSVLSCVHASLHTTPELHLSYHPALYPKTGRAQAT